MKYFILFVFAMAVGTAQAQQTAPCLRLSKVEVAEHVLHQDGATDVELTFEGRNCYVFTGSPALGHQRPAFEVQDEPGVYTRVGIVGAAHFDQTTVGASIFRAQEISVTLHLTASSAAELGKHKLPGLIHYKIMDGLGNVSEQTLSFHVPIKVATAKTPYVPGPPFDKRHPVWAKVLLPLEIIAFIPLFILAGLSGWSGC